MTIDSYDQSKFLRYKLHLITSVTLKYSDLSDIGEELKESGSL